MLNKVIKETRRGSKRRRNAEQSSQERKEGIRAGL
jgi:hypothetical protein